MHKRVTNWMAKMIPVRLSMTALTGYVSIACVYGAFDILDKAFAPHLTRPSGKARVSINCNCDEAEKAIAKTISAAGCDFTRLIRTISVGTQV
jgi:hypothetical protein